jgi:hypothetical protein
LNILGTKRGGGAFGSRGKPKFMCVQISTNARKEKGHMPEQDPKARLRQQIDDNLKRVYQEAVAEDVPDRFKQLLAQLRAKDSGDGNSGPGDSGGAHQHDRK